jgi:hypothetical protein
MRMRVLFLATAFQVIGLVAATEFPAGQGYNAAALRLDKLILERGRPDLVLLFDSLRQQCEKDATRFATDLPRVQSAITDYESALRATGATDAASQLEHGRRFLQEKFSYQPSGKLGLALSALSDETTQDTLRAFRRVSPGLDLAWRRSVADPFSTQLFAVQQTYDLARTNTAFRSIVEQSISTVSGQAYTFAAQMDALAGQTEGLNRTLELARQLGSGDLSTTLKDQLASAALARANELYRPLVDQAIQSERSILNAYEALKRANPGKSAQDLITQLPANLFNQQVIDELKSRQRIFEVESILGFGSQVAALSGDRQLANRIAAASEFYKKTEVFVTKMKKMSQAGSSLANSTAMTAASLSYVGMAMTVVSMFSEQGSSDNSAAILAELRVVEQMITQLGQTMNRRFDLLEFSMAQGFAQTYEQLALLRFDQAQSAQRLVDVENRLVDFQRQMAGWIDLSSSQLSDLAWRRFVDAANRQSWSGDLRGTYDDLVTLVADHSRDTIESADFRIATARPDMIGNFGPLSEGRLGSVSLANHRLFAYGNFLRGYVQDRFGIALTPPDPKQGVPNVFVWLRGVGMIQQMRGKFQELAGPLSNDQRTRMLKALDDLDGFWQNLASVKVDGSPSAFTFEKSLFAVSLDRLRQDLQDIQGLVGVARTQYASVNKGIDCWNPELHRFLPPFDLDQVEIKAENPDSVSIAEFPAGAPWANAQTFADFSGRLPKHLTVRNVETLGGFFTANELIAHRLGKPGQKLAIRLLRHGWTEMQANASSVWLTELGLFRGGGLLRRVQLRHLGQSFGVMRFQAGFLYWSMDDPAVAERMWGRMLDDLILAGSERLVASIRGPVPSSISSYLVPASITVGNGVATLTRNQTKVTVVEEPDVLNAPDQPAWIARRDAETSRRVTGYISELRTAFLGDFLRRSPGLAEKLDRYEEHRVFFCALLNFAAPRSLQNNAGLRDAIYGPKTLLPPSGRLIDAAMCEQNVSLEPAMQPAIGRLRFYLTAEYRARRFPQSQDYLTLARFLYTSQN